MSEDNKDTVPPASKPEDYLILVVDDQKYIRTILTFNLKRRGFQVEEADNGNRAIFRARQRPPDLILMDVMMPELDGIEATRKIREDSILRRTPILMLTAKGQLDDVKLALSSGANDYIVKPFEINEVVERVKKHLGIKDPEPTAKKKDTAAESVATGDAGETSENSANSQANTDPSSDADVQEIIYEESSGPAPAEDVPSDESSPPTKSE